MAIFPKNFLPDIFNVVKTGHAYEGRGEDRRIVGSKIIVVNTFDHYAQMPITILGLDFATLPSQEVVMERNMAENCLKARFKDLVIEFSGGDYGAIRYKGTASAVEFINLTPGNPPSSTPTAAK